MKWAFYNAKNAEPTGTDFVCTDEGWLRIYAAIQAASPVVTPWLRMDSCPVGEKVLFWNQETEEMFFGHKPDDAPHDEAVVTEFPHTAAWADAWMPRPPEPEGESEDPEAAALAHPNAAPCDAKGAE
jgi:hypothetical protein